MKDSNYEIYFLLIQAELQQIAQNVEIHYFDIELEKMSEV